MTYLKRNRFELAAGFITFVWAFLAWLTVIPNQDILADGIQVQSVINDPRVVLAFPGQKHGGPIEYPFSILAELLFPGNIYANGFIRPFLAFLTGFVAARLFTRLFPNSKRWSFLTALIIGPTIISGLLGPEGNPVGVWWLQPNWDVAWLLLLLGSLMIVSANASAHLQPSKKTMWMQSLIGGVVFGLGIFAHPAVILLAVPLAVLISLRIAIKPLLFALSALGVALGLIPAMISYVINAGINTWDPSHGAFIALDFYLSEGSAVIGLDGMPDYIRALLPYGFGLAPSEILLDGNQKSFLVWIFVSLALIVGLVGGVKSLVNKMRPAPVVAIALAWISAIMTLFFFITFITPVWIYGSSYSILFWMTLGVLPGSFRPRTVNLTFTWTVIAVSSLSTITHNYGFYSRAPERFADKMSYQNQISELAKGFKLQGVEVIYGSYYDVIPIGFASAGELRSITNTYNRFPLQGAEVLQEKYITAIRTDPVEIWGKDALTNVRESCEQLDHEFASELGNFELFKCPTFTLLTN